ncbi:iron-sulfur cluster assembly scaffold protein [Pseudooceanicola sp. HF7]|uniref:iron-sulfur cluster assembly scaffold protein n=1 Tax=Pseudooceanicola sp. HF7 TaxID=2721560 RepID=UPI001431FCEE|nr:iron-sulfur cluster assembly scaffold protein [Pseudooceanicola sp. HF7]NIZ08858.1 iron-sulfur cluster assembly scaffold protein [Pseudooceanicola sp. HF7]
MSESDLIKLYSDRILALATDIPRQDRLADPDATVRKRAPLCGSTITVDVKVKDGKVADYGQEVRACALGQAAASIVGGAVIGQTSDQVHAARDSLKAMLKEGGPVPPAPFDGLEVLSPASEYKNRHASIMLSLDALCEAMEKAAQSDCA